MNPKERRDKAVIDELINALEDSGVVSNERAEKMRKREVHRDRADEGN